MKRMEAAEDDAEQVTEVRLLLGSFLLFEHLLGILGFHDQLLSNVISVVNDLLLLLLWHVCILNNFCLHRNIVRLLLFHLNDCFSMIILQILSSHNFLNLLLLAIRYLRHTVNSFRIVLKNFGCILISAQNDASSAWKVEFEMIWSVVTLIWIYFKPYIVSSIKSSVSSKAIFVRFK